MKRRMNTVPRDTPPLDLSELSKPEHGSQTFRQRTGRDPRGVRCPECNGSIRGFNHYSRLPLLCIYRCTTGHAFVMAHGEPIRDNRFDDPRLTVTEEQP